MHQTHDDLQHHKSTLFLVASFLAYILFDHLATTRGADNIEIPIIIAGYKQNFNKTFSKIIDATRDLLSNGDKENANKNSALNSTQKEILGGLVSEQIMLNYELKPEIAQAHLDNWIYIHDLRDRFLFNINCCLFSCSKQDFKNDILIIS